MGSIPNQTPFSKVQNGEIAVDSALRLKIQIAAVSAGLTIPTSGGATGGGGGTVTIGGVAAGISTALPVSIRGGSTNQDVRLAAISSLSTALPVSIRGGSTNQDVRLAASSITLPVQVSQNTGTMFSGITVLSSAVSHSKVAVTKGTTTAIEVTGASIYNESANARRFYLQFGTTAFWKGGLASQAFFNWNFVGGYPLGAANKSVIVKINGGGTAVCTVFYRKR